MSAFVDTGASMKRSAFAAMVLLLGCHSAMAADSLTLTFGSYQSSPVVLTHFAIEMPLAETQRLIVVSAAEREMPRTYSANALSLPRDVDHDGHWTVAAQWVELQTDRAWRATVNVPIRALTEWHGSAQLNVIFGPNGLFLIGSDKIGNRHSDRVDVAYVCGKRVPGADRSWRTETGYFPDLPDVLDYARPVPARTHCPMPAR